MKAEQNESLPQEDISSDRELDMAVHELIAHVKWKMHMLPDAAKRFNLSDDAIANLKEYLQEELDFLSNLPKGTTLGQIMENHFERTAVVGERVTEKR